MSWTNYHSHTNFCDGKYPPNYYATEAFRQKFVAYGFSSHAPVPFECKWCMKEDSIDKYFTEIQKLKDRWEGKLQLYYGLEVDYIPGIMGVKNPFIQDLNLDYSIGSVHFVEAMADGTRWEIDGAHSTFLQGLKEIFGNNIQRAVTQYYEQIRQMVVEDKPSVIGHLDKIKMQNQFTPLFNENADWYQEEVFKTLQTIASSGLIMEVNTRGLYKKRAVETYPGKWVLEQAFKLGIPVTVSSDAHHPKEIAGFFTEALSLLGDIGYQHIHVLLDGVWKPVSFNENGIVS
ncbi:histidinol-phosphatase HisJ [Xanthocytophaga agilis]|uniref:Histidinol-phosphatase n=1 Tax=Xanthocytophaga agilis TaxID=3048010 RepID=A0AAE3RBM6_9BACT|nr:histidinol-phosphatase HisJ [Xanthocytophaga agilis]MDJ1505114.1 histidinol-phosphatase HisJ [Xanthocytophaga agilis]